MEVKGMEMKQCANGHYFDVSKNVGCPYCNSTGESGVTRPLSNDFTQGNSNAESAFPKTMPIGKNVEQTPIPNTTPVNNPDTNKTVGLNLNEQGIDPVRGWLVCIEGKKKGRDYSIHSEKNFIGRLKSNDISIDFDEAITRDGHAIVTYDIKKNKFWFQSGDGKSNVYLNDDIVLVPVELTPYDIILMGSTKLMFVPFCNDKFVW
jgi:hypothetical protein